MPGDVGRHQVRGELDTAEITTEGFRKRQHEVGFAEAGLSFEQNVAAAGIELSDDDLERLDSADPALAKVLDKLSAPLSDTNRAKLRGAAGRLRFWD